MDSTSNNDSSPNSSSELEDMECDAHSSLSVVTPSPANTKLPDRSLEEQFLLSLQLTDTQQEQLQRDTIDQANRSIRRHWIQERRKRLTASNFGRVCKLRDSTDRSKICESIIKGIPDTTAVRYGRENKESAIKKLEEVRQVKVKKCGLIVDEEFPYLGGTPGGLLDDDGIVQVKCPYVARNYSSIKDAVLGKKIKYFRVNESGSIQLKENDNCMYQIQGQLRITKRKYCLFVVWSPNYCIVQEIQRDDKFWKEKMEMKLKLFYNEHLLKAIMKYKE